jgi:hypothetical protein
VDREVAAMRRGLVLVASASLAVGCARSPWRAAPVWDRPVEDPAAAQLELPFGPRQNGTEIVIGVLALARAHDATSISGFEIQVGRCVRALTPAPARAAHEAAADPALDRIVVLARETRYRCKHQVDQILVPSEDPKSKLSDASLVSNEVCWHEPVEQVVARYRYEVEHEFTPPDLDEVERWTGARLVLGPPRCGAPELTAIRARFHRGAPPPARAGVAAAPSSPRAKIVALAREAQTAAAHGDAARASLLANEVLALLGDALGTVDDELARGIAAAHYFAIERDVSELLHRAPPATADQQWASAFSAELADIARRYEGIGDFVRLPVAAPWLRAGGRRLAALHARLALILDELGQAHAAAVARGRAQALTAEFGPM